MNLRDITDHHQYPGWLMRSPRWIYVHYFFLQIFFLRSRICRRAINRLLKNHHDKDIHILDVGCGEGQFIVPMSSRFLHFQFTGIDPLPHHIDFLHNLSKEMDLKNCSFIQTDMENHLPDSVGYSLIYIVGVLQYTSDPESMIRLSYRSQKIGDQLLIYTPVSSGIEYGFYSSIRRKYGHYDDARNHYKAINELHLHEWIRQAGYRIVTEEKHYGYAGSLGHQMMQSLIMLITSWWGIFKLIPALFFILMMPIFVSLQIVDSWFLRSSRSRYNGLLLILQK